MSNEQLLELTEKYGQPLFVYDAQTIIEQYNSMINALSYPKCQINYACKALTNQNILKLFKKLGAGIDAVSIEEVELALQAGFEPHDIMYTPNCVSFSEIVEAVNLSVRINIDNLSFLEQFGSKYGNSVPLCIRLNPHIMAGGNENISVGHIDSKFGISIHQIPHIKRLEEVYDLQIEGIHMHTGSDIIDVDVFLRGVELLLDIAKSFTGLDYIDFGSGFKVAYKEGDIETDIDYFGKMVSQKFTEFCDNYGRELILMFEPGKFLVSKAGKFLTKVNVIKQTTSAVFAGVNSGMNHMIRSMFYGSYHHITNLSNPSGKEKIYTVVGYICETDTFGWNRRINEIKEGDMLSFDNAGAYCFSMASNYNSRCRPAEVLIYEGKDYLIRKRESLEDLLSNQLEVEI